MKSKIYTRTGDDGETGLVSGNRVSKSSFRIRLYGDVDELNSHIGLLASHLTDAAYKDITQLILRIQSALFDLGSNLACEKENRAKYKLPVLDASIISEMESEMDTMDASLPKLKNFILPGGHVASSVAHICRTVTRRVERELVQFNTEHGGSPENSGKFLNRLSDYFFVLARYVNYQESETEIEWKPVKS
jgi:cob(I)alamin adenosyltransferase